MVDNNSVHICFFVFFFQAEDGIRDVAVTGVQTCALPICVQPAEITDIVISHAHWDHLGGIDLFPKATVWRSEEHTSELQSRLHLVCRLLLEKKKKYCIILLIT